MRTPVQVKICGLTRRCDVELAVECGASFVGFVLVPASRRYVPPRRWRELTGGLPSGVSSVAVVMDPSADELAAIREVFDIVQFHGGEPPELANGADSWKALHINTSADLDRMAEYRVDRYLLDAACGGSGQCCDWSLAASAAARHPIMLAGGLNPHNVAAAIDQVRPWGVDVAGGVEVDGEPGVKSPEKVKAFFKEIPI